MKAIINPEYGSPDVLVYQEVEKPTPADNEVVIAVQASSINTADWYYLLGKPFLVRLSPGGLTKPRLNILGGDIAGRVESIGKQVQQFKVGDEVYGDISDSGMGAFAEFAVAQEAVITNKPGNLSFDEAATVPSAAVTALQGLRDHGQIKAGQEVLIVGASGGVGTFAVQLAKYFGAEVSAVCSTGKIDLVRSLGADRVIDYTREDFSHGTRKYDLILGVNGDYSLSDYKRALKPAGIYVCVGGSMAQIMGSMILGPLRSEKGGKQITNMGSVKINQGDLVGLREILETGKVKPVIEETYPLRETAEAFRMFSSGHTKGKIVISVAQDEK
jgi:NADPH:quinone reductase-like Zn-dependent oxidoreductase